MGLTGIHKKILAFSYFIQYNFKLSGDTVGFPSGQRGQTVNLLAAPSKVRILLPPSAVVAELADAQDLKSCGTYTPVPVRFRSTAYIKR